MRYLLLLLLLAGCTPKGSQPPAPEPRISWPGTLDVSALSPEQAIMLAERLGYAAPAEGEHVYRILVMGEIVNCAGDTLHMNACAPGQMPSPDGPLYWTAWPWGGDSIIIGVSVKTGHVRKLWWPGGEGDSLGGELPMLPWNRPPSEEE